MVSSDYDVKASCTVVASSCSVADSSGLLVRMILWFHWTMMLYSILCFHWTIVLQSPPGSWFVGSCAFIGLSSVMSWSLVLLWFHLVVSQILPGSWFVGSCAFIGL